VVTYITAGTTAEYLAFTLEMGSTATAIGSAAVGAAAGSVASQLVGNAIGAQDGFSWKAVALSALTAGVTQGLPAGDLLGTTAGTIENTIVRAAVANAMTQGIAVAVGLQDHFDWRGVAASAIGAGVGGQVGKGLGGSSSMGEQVFKAGLTGLAAGTATALSRGGRVSVQQIASDAFGNALGSSLGAQIVQGGQQEDRLGNFINEQEAAQTQRDNAAAKTSFRQSEIAYQNETESAPASMGGGSGLRLGGGGIGMRFPAGAVKDWSDGIDGGIMLNGSMAPAEERRALRTYTVQPGDNPASIGVKFFGDSRAGATILADNGLDASVRGTRNLPVGTVLTLRDDISEGNLRAGGRLIGADTSIRAQERAAVVEAQATADQASYDAMRIGAWSGRTNQPTAATGGQSLMPAIDNSYYVAPGFITSSYNQGVAMMNNGPWYDRVIGGVAATAMAPMMLLEETGRALMNVPYHSSQLGQNAAQFSLATDNDQRVVAGLNFVSNTSAAFLGAMAVVPGAVSMRAPVLTAQEMAVGQFAGAEVNAAARATYLGDVYSPRFTGPVQWEYYYRGDATQRTSFLSSMAQERGVPASTEFLSSRSAPQFTDMYASHGNIGSQGLSTIGVSKDPIVADYFARGPSQTQNGFVTTFRIESREVESVAFRNYENRYDVSGTNPNLGRMEQEYLFHNQIDKKYIFQQQPVRPR
jgi:hypothetical protein